MIKQEEMRDKVQKDIGTLIAEYSCNPEDYSLVGFVKEILSIKELAIVDLSSIIYRCPQCGLEFDYQPDYRECIECGRYLDAYLKQAG